MRDLKKEQAKLQSRYRLHLNRIKDSHRLFDKELALMMGFGVEQADYVAKLRAGKAEIFTCDMITLSKNAIRELSDKSILQELVPEDYMAVAYSANDTNGSYADEIVNITMFSGKVIEESKKDHPDTSLILDCAVRIGREAATLKAEGMK